MCSRGVLVLLGSHPPSPPAGLISLPPSKGNEVHNGVPDHSNTCTPSVKNKKGNDQVYMLYDLHGYNLPSY